MSHPGEPETVFIVGAGRLGCGLARLLPGAGLQVLGTWSRGRATASRARRITQLPSSSGRLPDRISSADIVVLSVVDQAIGPMCERVVSEGLVGRGQAVIHCSGCLDLSPLEPARDAGAEVGSLHVLRAFSDPRTAHERFDGALALIDAEQPLAGTLQRLARAMGMRPAKLPSRTTASRGPSDERALYHAAAVLAAGGLVSLLDVATEVAVEAGLDEREALRGLVGLSMSALEGLRDSGSTRKALTGPVARGDMETVKRHRELLERLAPRTRSLYDALSERAASIVGRD